MKQKQAIKTHFFKMNKFDRKDRLINFADMIIDLTEQLPAQSKAASHLGGQI